MIARGLGFFVCNYCQKSSCLNKIEESHNIKAQGQQKWNCFFCLLVKLPTENKIKYE